MEEYLMLRRYLDKRYEIKKYPQPHLNKTTSVNQSSMKGQRQVVSHTDFQEINLHSR